MSENYFMGLDGFVWFTGVVEDRNDPEALGRVRVRCLGFHTENLNDIPTNKLPWAHVMLPVTSPAMQGLGHSPSFLVEGSWVIGFFRDAIEKQQPIIIGSLPGKPLEAPDYTSGFNDPRSPYSEQPQYAGTPTYGPYPVDGFDITMPSGHDLGESDTNRLAQGEASESHDALRTRRANRQTSIPIATQPFLPTVSDEAVLETPTTFDEPHPKDIDYNKVDGDDYGIYRSGLYPYNHVFESESGHLTEIDDTPGGERTFRSHSSGTYEEIVADGTKTVKVIGDNYEIIMGNSNGYIDGAVNLTIKGDVRHLIKGNYHLEVDGNYTQKIHKNMRTRIGASDPGGNLEEVISGGYTYNIEDKVMGRIGSDSRITTEGNEFKTNMGEYDLSVTSNITAISVTGKMQLTANAEEGIALSASSGIVAVTSGTTTTIKSATLMTIKSETDIDIDAVNIDMDATTLTDITAPTVDINGSTAINLN